MKLFPASIAGLLLFAASLGLLAWANEPTDALAVAGGTGMVISGALLGLTLLAWRWRAARGYVSSGVATDPAFYDDLASAFDETTEGYDGAAAVAR